MRQWILKIIQFVKDVAGDERIPDKDKKIVLAFLALIISPIDLIPDWIPVIGLLDDLILFSLILDYYFRVLDSEILLKHYPFDMKSYMRLKRTSQVFSSIVPRWLARRVWSYTGSPYRR
jgi:uncharacterized membrane protein YkvA (DUF1232 family)